MRTNIEINDDLMRKAMRCSASKTKRGTVEEALRLLVQTRAQIGIRGLRGSIHWEGDLDKSRIGRAVDRDIHLGHRRHHRLD